MRPDPRGARRRPRAGAWNVAGPVWLLAGLSLTGCEVVSGLADLNVREGAGGDLGTGGSGGIGAAGAAGPGGAGGTATGGAGGSGAASGGSGAAGGGGAGGAGGSTCSAPGEVDAPCCDGVCVDGAVCVADTCTSCGALGQPCCDGAAACDAGLGCDGSVAPAGSCQGCVVALETGSQHVCARLVDDTVWCWGINIYGELGQGVTQSGAHGTPVKVNGLSDQNASLAADDHSCAIDKLGALSCWGPNSYGECGAGAGVTYQTTPFTISSLGTTVTAAAAGSGHSCATAGGALYCWGANDYGELGLGFEDANAHNTPVPVTAIADPVVGFGLGLRHTCVLTDQGAVSCWGYNYDGQVGADPPDNTVHYAPATPTGLGAAMTQLVGRDNNNCAVKDDQSLWCWGDNWSGQLGDPSFGGLSRAVPTEVTQLGAVVDVDVGGDSACAIKTDKTVWCWGLNNEGQLGQGFVDFSSHPVALQVTLPAPAATIGVGYASACALLDDGRVFCWGRNLFGQIGLGADPTPTPNEVPLTCP